jgi:hypothetical protein
VHVDVPDAEVLGDFEVPVIPTSGYWYLSAAPELLALAAARRDDIRKAPRS